MSQSKKESSYIKELAENLPQAAPNSTKQQERQIKTLLEHTKMLPEKITVSKEIPKATQDKLNHYAQTEFENILQNRLETETPEQIAHSYKVATREQQAQIQKKAQQKLNLIIKNKLKEKIPQQIAESYETATSKERSQIQNIAQDELHKKIRWQVYLGKTPEEIASSYSE